MEAVVAGGGVAGEAAEVSVVRVRVRAAQGVGGGRTRGHVSRRHRGPLPRTTSLRPRHRHGTAGPGRAGRDVLLYRRPEVRVGQPVDYGVVHH